MESVTESDIQILVSTMNRRTAAEVAVAAPAGARVLIINQCTAFEPPPEENGGAVRMLSFAERGLSVSRNRALDAADAEFCVVADDDVAFRADLPETISRAFAEFPDAAAISFQIERTPGVPFRRYASRPFQHNWRTVGSVRSCELVLRRSSVGKLRFDERFGLGARWAAGEENVFLSDLLRSGLSARYYPKPIVLHAELSSGAAPWTRDTAELKGAVIRRMYGPLWPIGAAGISALNAGRVGALGWRAWILGLSAGARGVDEHRVPEGR